jgi:uncharacterized protein
MKKLLFLIFVWAHAGISFAASFDCNKASSKSEKLICSDQQLSQLDSELGKLYAQAKASATDADAFKNENIKRWKEREANCSDKQCLLNWYAARKVELSKWVNQSNNQQASRSDPSASSSRALTNDEIGTTMAECSGWYLSAYIVLSKIPGQADTATVKSDLALMTLDFAKKLIGNAKTDQISAVPMRQTNQQIKQGTIDQWLPTIAQRDNYCESYLKKNQPEIRKALGYK